MSKIFDSVIPKMALSDLSDEREDLDSALRSVEVDEDSGEVSIPEERLKSPENLRKIHSDLFDDDRARSSNRAKVQAMLDDQPPYDQAKLNELGRGHEFNVNFGEGGSIVNESINAYVDIFTSPQTLVELPIQDGVAPNMADQRRWEAILAREFTRMVRAWDQAQFRHLELSSQFVGHGVGFAIFDDNVSWHFRAAGLDDIKVPQRTRACSSDIDIATDARSVSASELYSYVRNESAAKAAGWNPQAVKNAIAYYSARGDKTSYDEQSPEQMAEQVKAHDFDSGTNLKDIKIVFAWVKEMDGSISQYAITEDCMSSEKEDADENKISYEDEFLFRKVNAYDDMTKAVQVFPYYTGNSGNIHTIRGLGHIVYPQVQASNMMQCSMLDSARDAMRTTYIAPSEKSVSQIPIVNMGSSKLIPSYLQVSTTQHAPDLQRSAMPAMGLLRDQINRMSAGSAMSHAINNGQDRRSKEEFSQTIEYYSSINAAAMRLYLKPWRETLVEMARRAFKEAQNTQTEAGAAAESMRNRCIRMGVPEEAIDAIDYEEASVKFPLGLGSKAARQSIFNRGASLLPAMDDIGREKFYRYEAQDLFGIELAEEFFPPQHIRRQHHDVKIAQLENNQLADGYEVDVDPSENFIVHLREHLAKLWELREELERGADLVEVTYAMMPIHEHAIETFEVAVVPNHEEEELKVIKQSLQQIGEIVENGQRAIAKLQREQQQAPQQEGGGQNDAIQKAQVEMQIQAQKAEQQMAIKQQEAEQKLVLKKAEHDQKLALADAEKAVTVRDNILP